MNNRGDDREFVNIDLNEEKRTPLTPEQEKRVRSLRDVERVRQIRARARKELAADSPENEGGSQDLTAEEIARALVTSQEKAAKERAARRSAQGGSRRQRRSGKQKGQLIPWLLLLLVAALGFFCVRSIRKPKNPAASPEQESKAAEEAALPEDGFYTVAVFGVDSRDGSTDKGALSDVNMIGALNWKTGELRLVSVYRDTLVRISEKGQLHKFNEAYFKGGSEQALWAMKQNLDIVPDDFVTFNWKTVIDSINILGGIDIELTGAEFFYINAFITETVEATGIGSVHLKKAGMNHLDGVQAVAYARLRLMDTDFQRTERQRKVVKLLVEKLKKADLATRIQLVTCVLPETKTSVSVNDLLPLARHIKKFHLGETCGFPYELKTTYVNKMDVVVPVTLESNVKQLHEFLYDDKNYKPAKSVQEINSAIIKKTGLK